MPFKYAALVLLFSLILPFTGTAQRVAGRFSTAVYTFEKFDTDSSSHLVARAFESIQLSVSQGNISFNTSLYGVTNISQSFGNDASVRVTNLYLSWNKIADVLGLQIGRFPVFAGIGNGTLDGGQLRLMTAGSRLTVLAFGGENVRPDLRSAGFSELDKNFFVGGQVIARLEEGIRMSASYANRHIQRDAYVALRPDSLFNPVAFQVNPDSRADQAFGIDVWYDGREDIRVHGRYSYDVNFKRTRIGEFGGRIDASDRIAFTGDYRYREPYVLFNSFFGLFPVSPTREFEGGMEYSIAGNLHTYGRLAYVRYSDDVSRRLSAGMYFAYGSIGYSGTNGYAGQLSGFDLQGMYPLLDRKLVPTIGFSFSAYRIDNSSPREDIFAATLGAVVRPVPSFSGDVQVQWLRNRIMDHDVRLYGKLNYWFSHDLHLFQQNQTPNE